MQFYQKNVGMLEKLQIISFSIQYEIHELII